MLAGPVAPLADHDPDDQFQHPLAILGQIEARVGSLNARVIASKPSAQREASLIFDARRSLDLALGATAHRQRTGVPCLEHDDLGYSIWLEQVEMVGVGTAFQCPACSEAWTAGEFETLKREYLESIEWVTPLAAAQVVGKTKRVLNHHVASGRFRTEVGEGGVRLVYLPDVLAYYSSSATLVV